jgi:2-iminobutanoate/2-iminopropanoate deaminase
MATIETVHTDRAPKAIGPYAQATIVGDLIYTAGQVALDPATMNMVEGGVGPQTAQVLENLAAVLEQAGSGLQKVAKTSVFLVDMADFAAMNEEYAKAFGSHRPARTTVAVVGLPRGSRVEIECVAVR